MLFGSGQNVLQPHYEKVADQVRVDILGSSAHVFLFKGSRPVADGGFDFSLRFHSDFPESTDIPFQDVKDDRTK